MSKTRRCLSPLLFSFASKYIIRKFQGNKEDLEMNGTHQLLVYADGVNLMGKNINIINKNTEALLDASKDGGLEINRNYMFMSHHQATG
jgi:hypothetical protein